MSTAFVFHPDVSYNRVQSIRDARIMPVPGLRYVAAVTGPWKIFEVVEARTLDQLAETRVALRTRCGRLRRPPNRDGGWRREGEAE